VSLPFEMLEIRFEGTFFTREQIERLQAIAGLPSIEDAVVHASGISGLVCVVKPFLKPKNARAEQDALRRIEKISKLARELAALLNDEPASDSLIMSETVGQDRECYSDVLADQEDERERRSTEKLGDTTVSSSV
jgi:hypothetical protein